MWGGYLIVEPMINIVYVNFIKIVKLISIYIGVCFRFRNNRTMQNPAQCNIFSMIYIGFNLLQCNKVLRLYVVIF